MKIAVCVSGHIRKFKEHRDNFILFLNSLKEHGRVSLYISTWDCLNTDQGWSARHGLGSQFNDPLNVDDLIELFKFDDVISKFKVFSEVDHLKDDSPLKLKNITDKEYSWHPWGINNGIINSTKMFFLIKSATPPVGEYDLIFRVRPDYLFTSFNFEFNPEPNTVYCAQPPCGGHYRMDDQFAYGGDTAMQSYGETFNKLKSIFDRGIFGDPEEILTRSVIDSGIKWKETHHYGQLFR